MFTNASARRLMGRFVYLQLAGLVLVWAVNWPLTKSVLGYISPSSFLLWRFRGAVVVMTAMMVARRECLLPVSGERVRLAIIGILQIGLCAGFATLGLAYVGAGRVAVLIYTMQLWALPLGWLVAGERITRMAMIGGVTVFSGLLLFMNPMLVNWHDSKVLLGNALVLLSAVCWALGACLYRRYKWQTSFWSQLFWQILWSGVVVGIAIPALGPRRPVIWNIAVISVLAYNWLGATVFCFFLWGKVLSVMRASSAGQFVSLTPVLAVLSSAALTGEAVTPSIVVSVLLIVAGIYLTARGK
jgi:drug/metabolite transporter (DMT)-like permease